MTTRIAVRVQPGARIRRGAKSSPGAVDGVMADGVVKLKVGAQAVDGKANGAVLELLAAVLGVKPRDLAIVRGTSSRNKVVAVDGLSESEVSARIAAAVRAARENDDD
jgi:uncharacterized protein YggU (UPF0235/DUF167 family)